MGLAFMLLVGVAIVQPRSDDFKVCDPPRFWELDKSGLEITGSWHIHCWVANDREHELVVMLQFQESGFTIEPYGLHPFATGILANMPEQCTHVTRSSIGILVKLVRIIGYVESWAKSSAKLFASIAQLSGTVKLMDLELGILTQARQEARCDRVVQTKFPIVLIELRGVVVLLWVTTMLAAFRTEC
jgi:hypothetical protein